MPGETFRIRVPRSTMWKPAICIREVAPRSYDVRVGETTFTRNRKTSGESPAFDRHVALAPLSTQSSEEALSPPVAPPTVGNLRKTVKDRDGNVGKTIKLITQDKKRM